MERGHEAANRIAKGDTGTAYNLTVDHAQPIIERFALDQWKTVQMAMSMYLIEVFVCVMHHNLLQFV